MNRSRFLCNRVLSLFAVSAAFVFCIGCHDPGYRTDVTATGEGGVAVAHPPSDTPPASAAPTDAVQSSLQHDVSAQDRTEALEAQLRQRDAEIDRLKRQLATQPATTP